MVVHTNVGDLMLQFVSIGIFALMIGFGYLCAFYEASVCSVIFVYAILLYLLSFRQIAPTCIALQKEDYVITLILTILICFYITFISSLSISLCLYFYLSCFLAYINYACGKRFASMFPTIDKSSKNGTI